MYITDDIVYIGVNDKDIDLFEGQYIVPNGMAYNSYIIKDEKIAVMDTVSADFTNQWIDNIERALDGKVPDYLVVLHMEPDHSSNIVRFLNKYKSAVVVSSSKSFTMMKNFYKDDFQDRRIIVGEGDELSLGNHTLKFIGAPMVHWPEVMVAYDLKDKVLFSADAFGKFGSLDTKEEWACEARRYYFGIVGKYGMQVQNLLLKISSFEVSKICPLHGPVLTENLEYYINLYNTWSSYASEVDGVFIAYTSVYGNTRKAVSLLEEKLKENGVRVAVSDLAREDMAEAVEDAFKYSKIVFATTTYNAEIFPFMREFINHLTERGFKNKKVGFIENGSWAPTAIKVMKNMLEKCKNLTYTNNNVTIISSLSDDNIEEIISLADEL